MQSMAASAFFKAGTAIAKDFSACSFKSPASFAATLVFSSSSFAAIYSTSADALSSPTFAIKILVSAFLLPTSTIFTLSSSYSPSTFDYVSAKI